MRAIVSQELGSGRLEEAAGYLLIAATIFAIGRTGHSRKQSRPLRMEARLAVAPWLRFDSAGRLGD